jgi:hypothetical protein
MTSKSGSRHRMGNRMKMTLVALADPEIPFPCIHVGLQIVVVYIVHIKL